VKTLDVAIIGGGVIGASTALELGREKLRVTVFDRQAPGGEASWAAAGMLSPAPDSPRDLPLVPLSAASLRIYPEFVASLEEACGKSCCLSHAGTLEIFSGAAGEQERDERVESCRRLGLAVERLSVQDAVGLEPELRATKAAMAWFPDEGTVDPRSLMAALIAAAEQRNVEIRGGCPVTALKFEGGCCTGLVAGGESFSAAKVVLAAGCFSSRVALESALLAPTRPVRGQMIALRPNGPGLKRVLRSTRGYLVPRPDGRIVAGSTSEEAGFEKRVTPEGMRKILDAAIELFPSLADAEVLESWSGLRPGTPDDLPVLGPTDVEGLLVATGHYRNGILLAPVTAKLVREWILNGRTEFDATAFSPLRFLRRKLGAAATSQGGG